jgi:hypothetical protein
MQTRFEHFALANTLGRGYSPPRLDGKLCFAQARQHQVFGVCDSPLQGWIFRLGDIRLKMIAAIGEWEDSHRLDDPSWSYYERWLTAFERLLVQRGLITAEDLVARRPTTAGIGQAAET